MRADYESMVFSDHIIEPSKGTDSPGGITPGNLENINSIGVPVLACDRTLSIIKANASFYDNSGYEPGTLDGMHFRDLTISLVSGESVWDAAITGRKTIGIGEVKLPKGSAFYQIHAIPLVSQDQLSSSILIFFHSPYGDPIYPSYDSIRESLSDSAEILAEPDGTILCVSPPVYSISLFEPDLVSNKNLWTWELFLDLRTRVDEMIRGLMTGKITHSFYHAGNRFMISVRVHDVVVLKRKVLHITINSFPGDNTEEDETEDTAFVSAIEHLSSSVCSGQFSYRIDLAGVQESRHSVALILNAMMEQCETHYTTLAMGIEQMKSGWIPTSIQCSTGGPFHDIFTHVNEALDSLQQMMATVESFTMSVTEGNLTVKGDTVGLCGYYQALISGMNQMLFRLNAPLREMRRVAGEYASCRFSSSMDETIAYPGDFAAMKQSMDAIGIWCAAVVGEIDRVSRHYADGDFTAHMSPRLEVTGDFITIRDSLDNIGVQVSESIGSLRSAAEILSQEAEGIKKEIARISGDAEILASYTTTVSDRTTCVQDEVSRMIVSSNAAMQALCEMNGKVQAVAQTSAQTHTLSAKGVLLANQSREGIDAISGAAGLVDSGISRIHEELIRIEKIIRVVTDNANQTNFLAINAAIEAAHAGSYGRGFAAIAGEVKQLAVRSKESTTNISETLEALNDAFRQVKETVFQVQGEIQSRSTGICEMVSLFEEMIKEVEIIAAMSRDTGILTHDQENRISDLHKRSLIIGDLMSQTTRDAEATAQTCSSSCSSVEQIAGHIETVAAYANEIHAQISRFTV